MIKLIDQLPVQNELGESVIWDKHRQRLWWTDIAASKLFRYDPVSQDLETWRTPERLCCFAPVACDGRYQDYLIAAFESGFAYYQPETGRVEWLQKVETDNLGNRLNDGRTDRQGRFWAGTMVENRDKSTDKGRLYCLNHDLSLSSSIHDLSITNSLCWSPDSGTMYHCDTPKQHINKYDFDPDTGQHGSATSFVKTDQGCYPDGSIVDAEGFLWNAQWGGSQVVRYDPDGSVDTVLKLPVSQPSCVAFGGADLNLLFITTAHQDMSNEARVAEPGAGDLFVFETNIKGLVESPFRPVSDKDPADQNPF